MVHLLLCLASITDHWLGSVLPEQFTRYVHVSVYKWLRTQHVQLKLTQRTNECHCCDLDNEQNFTRSARVQRIMAGVNIVYGYTHARMHTQKHACTHTHPYVEHIDRGLDEED